MNTRENKHFVKKLKELRDHYDSIGNDEVVKLYDKLLVDQTWKGPIPKKFMKFDPTVSWNKESIKVMQWDPRESWNQGINTLSKLNPLNPSASEFVPGKGKGKGGKSRKHNKGGRKSHKTHKSHKGRKSHKRY